MAEMARFGYLRPTAQRDDGFLHRNADYSLRARSFLEDPYDVK